MSRRENDIVLACLFIVYFILAFFVLPAILVLIGLIPTVTLCGILIMRELHRDLQKAKERAPT
jgi:hypothetical protein